MAHFRPSSGRRPAKLPRGGRGTAWVGSPARAVLKAGSSVVVTPLSLEREITESFIKTRVPKPRAITRTFQYEYIRQLSMGIYYTYCTMKTTTEVFCDNYCKVVFIFYMHTYCNKATVQGSTPVIITSYATVCLFKAAVYSIGLIAKKSLGLQLPIMMGLKSFLDLKVL